MYSAINLDFLLLSFCVAQSSMNDLFPLSKRFGKFLVRKVATSVKFFACRFDKMKARLVISLFKTNLKIIGSMAAVNNFIESFLVVKRLAISSKLSVNPSFRFFRQDATWSCLAVTTGISKHCVPSF